MKLNPRVITQLTQLVYYPHETMQYLLYVSDFNSDGDFKQASSICIVIASARCNYQEAFGFSQYSFLASTLQINLVYYILLSIR